MRPSFVWQALTAAAGLVLAWAPAARADKPDPKGVAFFEKKIRPALVEHCYKCHSEKAKKSRGGLLLDTRAGLRAGGDTGPAVVAGDPKKSLLLKALRHEGPKMPSESKRLPDAVVADFEAWVKMGAPDPRDGKAVVKKGIDYDEARKHWAYQPVKVTAPPAVKNAAWPAGAIDRYVLAKVEAKGLKPAPDAAKHTLLRRVAFDLTGLPPTPEEVDAFAKDTSSDAYEKVVDRLLKSSSFGEHWARHWLDGVRYNPQLPTVERYRDWVARACNDDLPYDQFVVRQLAGDLLPAEADAKKHDDNLIATQLLALNTREMDPVEGMVEVFGQQLLGVSINCAKCHDHKFDAYSQADYYALAGVFTSSRIAGGRRGGGGGKGSGLVALKGEKAEIVALTEGDVGDTHLLIRGERGLRGALVPRRFPAVLAGDEQTPLGKLTRGSGRLELAKWVADPKNPLTARVMANRVWQRLLGSPLVETPNDFGLGGAAPTHPELLDYLADSFVRDGWSVKKLIRQVVLSRTYRQASRAGRAADPENVLLARMPVRRLQYEQIVDSLTAVGGLLKGGPPPAPAKRTPRGEAFDGKTISPYRALYHHDGKLRVLFDGADPELLTEKREASVTAPQLLFFLNNKNVYEVAAAVARRAEKAGADKVGAAYRLLFARAPTDEERAEAAAYLKKSSFTRYCHTLLCASEFIYLD